MQGAGSPFNDLINSDVEKAKIISIVMIIFAAWAGIEAISNVAGIEIPPETGMATNIDPDDTQRTNNGVIIGLGAVLGTVGIIIQLSIPRGTVEEEIVEESPKFNEDLVKLTEWLCSRGTTTAQFFEWADVDKSGTIDMAEFANALRKSEIANLPPWEIEELVKIMDINGDGKINLPELDLMLMKIQKTLGIYFHPYVEEDTEDEEEPEAEDESKEEPTEEAVAENDSAEDDAQEETGETEESEDENEATEEETEAEDDSAEDGGDEEESEEETGETEESEDENEDAEEETEAEEESKEEPTEEAEAENDSAEDGGDEEESEEETGETEESEGEVAEEETEAEEESKEEPTEEAEAEDDSAEDNAEEETEETEESEDENEATEEETEAEEETEEEPVVEEIPKKKKKF